MTAVGPTGLEVGSSGVADAVPRASVLPRSFALHCPRCRAAALHDDRRTCPSCGFALASEGRVAILEHAPVEEDYSPEGAGVQQEVRESHFWFSMRNLFILQLMQDVRIPASESRFVEYGCSNGLVMAELERAGWNVLGTDMHLGGLRNAAATVRGPLVCSPLDKLEFETPVDVVGFFDVIEHLQDDHAALEKAAAELRPGGYVVVTVPAFQGLWSTFDVLLGHKRRYTAGELANLFGRLGLEVVTVRYAFAFMFPLVWLQRKLVREAPASEQRKAYYRAPHPLVNAMLGMLCRLEMVLLRLGIRLPFGTSVMAVARKPAA